VKTILSVCLACLFAAFASAQQQPVIQVHTALNHLTVIEAREPITMAAAGSDAFEIERHANRVFVKPTRAGVSTNLFVWTDHGRSVYELQPAADVSKMDVLIGSAQTPSVSSKAELLSDEDVSKIAGQVLSHTLLNAERVNAVGLKTQKNRVNVRLEEVVRGNDAIYVRYQVTNLSAVPYRVLAPEVSLLTTNETAPSSLPAANSQLGAAYIDRLPTPNRQPIEVLHSEIGTEDVALGQTSAGVLAIKTKDSTPTLYQFVFGSDGVSPVVAQAVL
jgi:hypothetical protein